MRMRELVESVVGRGVSRSLWSRLPAEPGERPLCVAGSPGDGHLVASDQALYYQRDTVAADAQGGEFTRLPWDTVVHVAWYRDEGTLELLVEGATAPIALRVTEPGRLPETVRERVMATILISEHFRLRGNRGVRIAARRQPGSADIRWMVAYDPGLDAHAAQVSEAVDRAIARLRDQVG